MGGFCDGPQTRERESESDTVDSAAFVLYVNVVLWFPAGVSVGWTSTTGERETYLSLLRLVVAEPRHSLPPEEEEINGVIEQNMINGMQIVVVVLLGLRCEWPSFSSNMYVKRGIDNIIAD